MLSMNCNERPQRLIELAKSLGALRTVASRDDYSRARGDLISALELAKNNADKELTDQIDAMRITVDKSFTGDVTRSFLIRELELLVQMMNLNEEFV